MIITPNKLQRARRVYRWTFVDSAPNCTAIDYSANYRKFKRLSCSVGFRGDWAPVMEWRQGGFNGTIVTTGVQNNTTSNFVSQSISISVDDGEENAISYTCVIFFSAYMGNVNATATNIPNYIFTWPGKHHHIDVTEVCTSDISSCSELDMVRWYHATVKTVAKLKNK